MKARDKAKAKALGYLTGDLLDAMMRVAATGCVVELRKMAVHFLERAVERESEGLWRSAQLDEVRSKAFTDAAEMVESAFGLDKDIETAKAERQAIIDRAAESL